MIQYDSQIAFRVPEDSRENYLIWVDNMIKHCGLSLDVINKAWDTYNDPIIIADRAYFSQKNWSVIATFMSSIGAVNITDSLRDGQENL